ncbi:MAG TPA: hypothetical protein VKB36_03180 [Vicinamibacterales bacterium]|nr:hypothetical protein [Vicinamibacterales bacterium]
MSDRLLLDFDAFFLANTDCAASWTPTSTGRSSGSRATAGPAWRGEWTRMTAPAGD